MGGSDVPECTHAVGIIPYGSPVLNGKMPHKNAHSSKNFAAAIFLAKKEVKRESMRRHNKQLAFFGH